MRGPDGSRAGFGVGAPEVDSEGWRGGGLEVEETEESGGGGIEEVSVPAVLSASCEIGESGNARNNVPVVVEIVERPLACL